MNSEYFLTGYIDEIDAMEEPDVEDEIPESDDERDPFEGLIEPDLEHIRRRPGREIMPTPIGESEGDAA